MTEDLLTLIGKEKNVHNIIVLTHNIDFIFIQTVVLKTLNKMGSPSLTIFADAQCVQESYENQKQVIFGLGKRYRVVPVHLDRHYDRFHPKAVLLSGKEKASLYIGSGNLTFGGWRQNAEIWNHYDSLEDGTSVFSAFKDYLDGILSRLPYINNISNVVDNTYNQEIAPWSINMEPSSGLIGRIDTNLSLLEQMKHHVETGCEKLIIQSPYFDKEGKTVNQFNALFKPKRIEIFAQNRHSELTEEIINGLNENITVVSTDFHHYVDEKSKKAFIHAKYYAFLYQDKAIVFSGSANCSQAAMNIANAKIGNAELMSVNEMTLDEFDIQYYSNIAKVKEGFVPRKQIDIEKTYEKVEEKAVQIHAAQFEYKKIKIAVTIHENYEVRKAMVDNIDYPITVLTDNLLHVENLINNPSLLCLLLKNKLTNEEFYSDEIWIDHERELSTSVKTRSLSDFIQSSNELSWSHNAFGDLLKVFNDHLVHTPKRENVHNLGTPKAHDKVRKTFNPSDIFIDNYHFTSQHNSTNSSRYSFDIHSILRQYLGLYNQTINDKDVLTQEELQKQFDQDSVDIGHAMKNQNRTASVIDEKGQKKVRKLIETLVDALTDEDIITNRPLRLLLDDLKVSSIILRLGLTHNWITQEDYFDVTYTLWTEFFFSCELDENKGYLDLKLDQEDIDIEELYSAELSASMLTWIFAVVPSNDLNYIRLLMSAILVQAKYSWVFYGDEYEKINAEVDKALVAFKPEDIDYALNEHNHFWKFIVNTGNAFAELIHKIYNKKISDYKDRLQNKEIPKGELLWKDNANFYIVNSTYQRKPNKQGKYRAYATPLTKLTEETSFLADFTVPISDLLNLEEFTNLRHKQYLLDFINQHLTNVKFETNVTTNEY